MHPCSLQTTGGMSLFHKICIWCLHSFSDDMQLVEISVVAQIFQEVSAVHHNFCLCHPCSRCYFFVLFTDASGMPSQEPEHMTALLGQDVILHCPFEYPDGMPVPYLVQWHKKDHKIPIYIWYVLISFRFCVACLCIHVSP